MTQARRNEDEVLTRYAGLMEEVKLRISAIEAAANGDTRLHSAFNGEFCFLQLRMICEVIALACLTAHGDAPVLQTNRVQKAYAADRIMTMLNRCITLLPQSNPPDRPASADGGHIHRIEDALPGFLDKPDLLVYRKCGDALHRGTIQRLSPLKAKDHDDFAEIVRWGQRVIDLLGAHIIIFRDGERIIHCQLNSKSGKVRISLGRAQPG